MALIEFNNVSKDYGVGETVVHAVSKISVSIDKGEFVAILGKSGSGKSTFLSLLGGLEQPTRGHILWRGDDLSNHTEDELAIMRRTDVGVVFQHFFLLDSMTALDNTELPLLIAGVPRTERREWCMKLLDLVGLKDRATHYPNELSGGERQRVGIARALANRASVIIADEPTGDLDSKKGREIVDLLYRLNQGTGEMSELDWQPTLIMVTHDVYMLRKGMRVLTLSDGMIIGDDIFDGDHLKFDALGSPSIVETHYED